jgi:hypothetical protein
VLKWWQPYYRDRSGKVLNPYDHWPDGLPLRDDIEAYAKAAESLNFIRCDAGWEPGFEKIVLFYLMNAEPSERSFTHAAKQVSPDRWQSKFGKESDVEHAEGIHCIWYGDGRLYMKRPRI